MRMKSFICLVILLLVLGIAAAAVQGATPSTGSGQSKPNILVIWGDDVGYWNVSHNNRGMMGYKTPNIDRIANEGLSFTDYYGEQSCTVGCHQLDGIGMRRRREGKVRNADNDTR